MTFPVNGTTDVPVNSTITWNAVVGVPGYIISIGTTLGGVDIVNQTNVGAALSYTPPLGFPENTQIYVTITLFFFDPAIPDVMCPSSTFRTEDVTSPPPCRTMTSPADGAINVNIGSNISWNYSPTATGYRISMSTVSGTGNIVNDQDVGNVLLYNPILDLPPSTQIFVQITPYNENGDLSPCLEQSFTTGAVAVLPGCATLISPLNGEINVPLTPLIEWTAVAGAAGYKVTIGSSPFTTEVLDNVVFSTNSTFVINFEPNRTFFITIIPFNAAGEAIGCITESFSTIIGCGPYFDSVTGELIIINPEISFPDIISFCQDELPFLVSSTDAAEGFRWFQIDEFGNETLISDTSDVSLVETGEYRYEAYNTVLQASGTVECPTSKFFNVVSSEIATINSVNITEQGEDIRITVDASGIGDYEYALNDTNGPYQDSNVFNTGPAGSYTVYVRDKNGCGIAQELLEQDLTLEGFPKFFTPNGDGVNDFWQFIPTSLTGEMNIGVIYIFDRYGILLTQIMPTSKGWDGTFNGQPLPASSYWFNARDNLNNEIRGFFALKR
ncbi:T9SS type B sorting domain-containing protein [uncultured Eudoraea sp.]|uniref:T9SS type B sorting domain-containing protein n=1 Tax=uncultured Eudoraea sp. TaxID=1035614 RepID=UPI002635030D|nr:T9SS type B sorting domain-containing protein [uncultured Eudoraea sp.]